MLEELVREGAESDGEEEKMVIIYVGPRYAEEGPSGDKLKDKAAETPDVKGLSTAPVRINSGDRRARGVTSFVGGSVKKYAVQVQMKQKETGDRCGKQ
jgi:hypothetical protein